MTPLKLILLLVLIVCPLYQIDGHTSDLFEEISTFDSGIGCWDIHCINDTLYVTDFFTGLHLIDITNLSEPNLISTFRIGDGGTHKFIIENNSVYLPDWSDVLEIVDISDPKDPQLVGLYTDSMQSYDITIHDNLLFLACESWGLLILNASNPNQPSKVAQLSCGEITHVEYFNGYIYATVLDKELQLIDVTDPFNPILVKTFTKYNGIGLIIDNIAITSNTLNPGYILNITNAKEPVELGCISSISYITDLRIRDNFLFISAYEQGIFLADISNLAKPSLIGHYSHDNPALSICCSENTLYATFKNLHLKIFQLNFTKTSSIHLSIFTGQIITVLFFLVVFKKKKSRNFLPI